MHRGLLLLAALALSACGGGNDPPAPAPTSTRVPSLARAPSAEGEIVIRGDLTPATHGPYSFNGAYTVAFEQYSPEDPSTDFAANTSFVAVLDRRAGVTTGDSIPLFEAARESQTRRVRIEGRFFVDVTFGDFPYVIRFTPRD